MLRLVVTMCSDTVVSSCRASSSDAWEMCIRDSVYIDDTPGLTPSQLRSRCRRLMMEQGLDLIVIDYLGLMGTATVSYTPLDVYKRQALDCSWRRWGCCCWRWACTVPPPWRSCRT